MRIASGVTDQYVYFKAVDATDLKTPETGLSGFTVYRSRNGGSATAMTTPTIAELSSANMPGVYSLLADEDMTIDSGDETQEMIFHITHASMAPVDRVIELYRPKITAGNTLSVTSGGVGTANVTNLNSSTTAAAHLALSAAAMLAGTVDAGGLTPTTTSFDADDITEATTDHFKDRMILFTSGAMQYQAARITGYSLVSGRGRFVVTTMTEAPADNVTFIIV